MQESKTPCICFWTSVLCQVSVLFYFIKHGCQWNKVSLCIMLVSHNKLSIWIYIAPKSPFHSEAVLICLDTRRRGGANRADLNVCWENNNDIRKSCVKVKRAFSACGYFWMDVLHSLRNQSNASLFLFYNLYAFRHITEALGTWTFTWLLLFAWSGENVFNFCFSLFFIIMMDGRQWNLV